MERSRGKTDYLHGNVTFKSSQRAGFCRSLGHLRQLNIGTSACSDQRLCVALVICRRSCSAVGAGTGCAVVFACTGYAEIFFFPAARAEVTAFVAIVRVLKFFDTLSITFFRLAGLF